MKLIMLVQPEVHYPLPASVEVVQDFGEESVRDSEGKCHRGFVILLRGDEDAFKEWLRPFGSVWTTNNPMMGWELKHIKG